MGMISITYNGKTVEKEEVCPGILKSGSAYLVQCSITKEWTYCNEPRLAKLTAKFGSQEALGLKYVSRQGKQEQRGDAPASKSYKPSAIGQMADLGDEPPKDLPWNKPGKAFVSRECRPPGYDGPLSVGQREDGTWIADDKA